MIKLIAILAVACVFPVSAAVTCSTTATGTTWCSGTDNAGRPANTESYTTGTGTTYTKGSDGNGAVNRRCNTTATGTTYCE